MLVQCNKCGAPLDVAANTSIVRCSYCGHYNRVRSMQTLAAQAPPNWAPPMQWTPPPQWQHQAPLPYRAPPKQTSIQMIVLLIVIAVLVSSLCPFAFIPLLFLDRL